MGNPYRRDLSAPVQLRICFVKYADPNDVPVALHLSNTVFIDRAVSVTLYHGSKSDTIHLNIYSFISIFHHFQMNFPMKQKV